MSDTDSGYRAYLVGTDGHFFGSEAFICDNDDDAIVQAKRLVIGHDVELWNGKRLVIRLSCSIPPASGDPETTPKP